jgi:hypothetical protein
MSHETLIGILGLTAVAACWAFAVVLYRVSSTGSVARNLTLLLAVEGFVLISAGFPEFAFDAPDNFYASHPVVSFILNLVHHMGDAAMVALYPPFLARALNTTLTRPFADKRVRIGLATGSAVLGLTVVFTLSQIAMTLLYSVLTLLFVYALLASIHAWRTANSGMVRSRAGIFALAFGFRDVGWGLSYAIFAWLMWTQPDLAIMPDMGWLGKIVYALGTLIAVPLVAYGILRTQLFDIDLRIRWTIKQSTVAAAFVAIFYLVSEGADRFLSSELGNILGLIASAAVVFFLAPLQRFAERVASTAMPNTENTPEYAAFRKMQVYEAAVAEARLEGGISNKERALLIRLRDSLGIAESDAEAIERELGVTDSQF